jgi:hypothetical protein
MPRFLIDARYEASDHGAEPDFSDEVDAPDHEAAVEEVYARFQGHIFVVSGISEWHEPSGTWVDIDDPLYPDFFDKATESPGL